MILKYSSFFLVLFAETILAQNINYAQHDLHTQVIAKNQVDLSLQYTLMNDQIDFLKFKESEFTNSIGSIGDTDSLGFSIRYGLSDKTMLSLKYSARNINYLSEKLINYNYDFFVRHNIFQDGLSFFNSGVSIDLGYVQNTQKDFHLSDIDSINKLLKRIKPNASLLYSDGITPLAGEVFPRIKGYYARFNNTTSGTLVEPPSISLIDSEDKSIFVRALTGFHTQSSITDFYIGYKATSIKNTITTTAEILNLAKQNGINDLEKILDRKESMLFFGFNYSMQSGKFIYEFNYEYDRFLRDAGLDYVNYNHIINANISYMINKDLLLSVGGKILYRQLNGEIPYLYNTYTQTTFDHKYGYATFGLQYSF